MMTKRQRQEFEQKIEDIKKALIKDIEMWEADEDPPKGLLFALTNMDMAWMTTGAFKEEENTPFFKETILQISFGTPQAFREYYINAAERIKK